MFSKLTVALAACAAALASAQQAPPKTMRLPDLTPGHPDVETSASLVGATAEAIAVGNVLTVVCGFVNNGETALNISGIMGSLNDPVDFARYLHNFSGVAIGEVVEPGGEMSLEYRIPVPIGFPEYPFTLQMAITVFYEDDSDYYSTTFYNETVSLVEGSEPLKAETVLPYGLGLLATALILFLFPESHPAIERSKACPWRKSLVGIAGSGARSGAASSSKSDEDEGGDFSVPSIVAVTKPKNSSSKGGKAE